jgi:hypothetical protein
MDLVAQYDVELAHRVHAEAGEPEECRAETAAVATMNRRSSPAWVTYRGKLAVATRLSLTGGTAAYRGAAFPNAASAIQSARKVGAAGGRAA